jgi:hypothetical protein
MGWDPEIANSYTQTLLDMEKSQNRVFPLRVPGVFEFTSAVATGTSKALAGQLSPQEAYGPKYDILDESQKRSEVNEYVDDENNLYFNPLTMTKKDLESLLHQPDPALTVQQLPQNPKISFRKGHPSEQKDMDDLTTPAPETTTVFNRGMKEVAMLRPNTGAVSPLYELIEAQQLKDLAKGKASYVNKKSF